jgi:hypothetical protein
MVVVVVVFGILVPRSCSTIFNCNDRDSSVSARAMFLRILIDMRYDILDI